MRFSLTVTQFDGSASEIIQNDVFGHGSAIKHGLQRKAESVVLNEDYRESFASAKWTNEDVVIGEETVRMMHKSVFHAEYTRHLVLRQVSDETEITFESAVRNVNADKDYFIAETVTAANGESKHLKTIQAANLRAAKLRLNGDAPDGYDGQWTAMPFEGGIYRNHESDGTVLVLRPATEAEAAELGASE